MSESQTNMPVLAAIKKGRSNLLWIGVGLLAVGILALIFPFFTTLTTNFLVGMVFFIGGVFALATSFTIRGAGPFFGMFLFAVIMMAAGTTLLFNPDVGIFVLTIAVAIVFIFDGVSQIAFAIEANDEEGWIWLLIGGLVSIILGFFILSDLEEMVPYLLGMLVAVNFIVRGITLIFFSRQIKEFTDKADAQFGTGDD